MVDPFPTEFVRGALELLLLGALQTGPSHGYRLIQRLREESEDRLRMNEGAVYPLLHRLERDGLLRSSTSSVGGRSRKVYAITAAGRRALAARRTGFREFAAFLSDITQTEEN